MDDFLAKPLTVASLRDALRRAAARGLSGTSGILHCPFFLARVPVTFETPAHRDRDRGLAGAATRPQSPGSDARTWKLNVEKSKSPYKSGTSVIEERPAMAVKVTADMVGRRRHRVSLDVDGEVDGKERAITGTTPV
jgi:hypothetical protein